MTTHSETRVVPYPPELMFQVVGDVEKYPQFLPWCVGLRVLKRDHVKGREVLQAEMIVGYKGIREKYTSRVILDCEAMTISVTQTDGPFRVLENHWKFAAEDNGTKVDVSLAYEFRSRMLNMVAGVAFGRVYEKMADAFEGRAKKLFEQAQQ
ncbi:MAG TPA: type II toxin-antitoxin system RatA family toxin [Rhizomicrobium sp.]|jgi:coenzyme Q-binding protein COQ10|nr:type II toxin-antitoxin system RatA family toxin [Rhizomicrobium sp.]